VETDTRIPGCRDCYSAEDAGIESRRQGSKKLYEEYHKDTNIELSGPTGIDYSVGNLCNLKCVICGPTNSSQWVPDFQKLHPTIDIARFQYKKNEQLEITDPDLLQNIKNVHFHGGGEPLLSDNHVRLLQKIQEVVTDINERYKAPAQRAAPAGQQIPNEFAPTPPVNTIGRAVNDVRSAADRILEGR
jgi:hypothetical protein